MDIPFDIKLTLRTGSVYYFEHRDLSSSEPHYFVVLNSDPLTQQVLLMSVFTSKIDSQERRIKRAGHHEETLVKISSIEYSALSVDSCINCNKVFSKPLPELVAQWSLIKKKPDDIPDHILEQVLAGVELSTMVSEEEKALIRTQTRS